MNTPINLSSRLSTSSLSAKQTTDPPVEKLRSMVLQPRGSLNQENNLAFQIALEQALHQVTQTVIVDLLWVEAIDSTGLAVLKSGVQLAAKLKKILSFQAMKATTRAALEQEQAALQADQLGTWVDVWHEELDHFLGRRHHQRTGVVSTEAHNPGASTENRVVASRENNLLTASPARYVYPYASPNYEEKTA